MKESKQETTKKDTICVPRIIGDSVFVDDSGLKYEYFELNCDSCMETECVYYDDVHSEEEKEFVQKLLEEQKVESEDL